MNKQKKIMHQPCIFYLYKFSYVGILPSNRIEEIYIKGLNKTFKGEKIN
jgi:hypothetical protein